MSLIGQFVKKMRKDGIANAVSGAIKYTQGVASLKFRKTFGNSYSQCGEDIEIDRLLGNPKNGTYVDVGANHPDNLSNTKRFYLRGWSGINIEPNHSNYLRFVSARPRDTNLNIGIGKTDGELEFHIFDPHELSTFSKEESEKYVKLGYRLVEVKKVAVQPLAEVIGRHCVGKKIDFLSVDTEGFDLAVLQSNDWKKYRPVLVCVECVEHGSGVENKEIGKYLEANGYARVYFNGLNAIYKDAQR